MQIATTGLVLRQVKVGEADRILTILTPDLGDHIRPRPGAVMRMKKPAVQCHRACSATQNFPCPAAAATYFVDAAQIKNVFHGVSATVEGMALASLYGGDRHAELSPAPAEGEADAQLRLLLNCLYMLSEQKLPMCGMLKADL